MTDTIHDTVMIGAGPSALAAAVYTTREDIETVLYEKGVIGGLAAITDLVDNYPGFPEGVRGLELAEQLQKQAERFGAKIEYGEISNIRDDGDYKTIVVDGADVKAKTVLIATGSDYNKLGIPGEAEYYGRGVHYCATCDGAYYREKRLVVVGGGNSAVQESIFLTRYASHIDLLVRSTLKASDVLQHELQKLVDAGKITVHLATIPTEVVVEDNKVTHVAATKDGKDTKFDTEGVFVFVGLKPNTQFLDGSGIELDEQRLIKTDQHLETTMKGVFASGDVRSGATMQIASAVGEGATAALAIREYLDNMPHVEVVPELEAARPA
jgi:thioredoxin reductase (NADPH)